MQKAYNRQNFHNGTDPALDEVDMNKIDQGLDIVDDRVIALNQLKADKTEVLGCVAGMTYSISTGILKITFINGAVQTVNLGLNNVALSMSPLGVITMENSEGETYECDLREIINSDLAELGDVNITDPEEGQVLKYNAETGKWENGEGGLGTAVSYEAQTLTDPQKAQARVNIDAASVEELSNENLLLNGWFIVNQNGQSNYNGGGVTFNNWVLSGATNTATQNADGSVTIAKGTGITQASFYQRIEPERYSGHDITVSMLLGDNTVRKGTAHYTQGTAVTLYSDSDIAVSIDGGNALKFDVRTSSMTFKYLKAEIGKASTILLDTKPEYAFELARCQTTKASSSGTLTNKGNLVTSNSIAPTEDGATASQAYTVGKHFFRGGDYCICISPIASGGSFTLNTNYKVEPLSEGNHGWVDVTSQCTFDNTPSYMRKKIVDDGHTYQVGITLSANFKANYAPLITLPKAAAVSVEGRGCTGIESDYATIFIENASTQINFYGSALTGSYVSIALTIPHVQ